EQMQPAPAVREDHPGRGKKITGIVLASIGVVAVGTGIAFGIQAGSNADKVSKVSAAGGTWTSELADTESAGKGEPTIATIAIGVGAVAIAGGVALYIMGASESSAPPPVAIAPLPGGADFVLSWRY